MPRLAGAGSRCHNKSKALWQQQQQQLADILVQVPPNNYVAVVWMVVVVVGGGCAACLRFGAVFSRERSFFLYCRMCLRYWGCPVVLNIELSVSARYQKTRVLQRAAVCGMNFKNYVIRVQQNINFGPIRIPENNDSNGKCAPRSMEAFHKQENSNSLIGGTAATDRFCQRSKLIPSWRLLVIQPTPLTIGVIRSFVFFCCRCGVERK